MGVFFGGAGDRVTAFLGHWGLGEGGGVFFYIYISWLADITWSSCHRPLANE